MSQQKQTKTYNSFLEFYPYYLSEHSNQTNRRLHYVGTSLSMLFMLYSVLTAQLHCLFYVLLVGYGFAWTGHFFFEKNKPATFKYPFFSLMGDFKMWYQMTTGSLKM